MLVSINNVGQYGQVLDVPGIRLPANAWTSLQNCRCEDGLVFPIPGHESYATPSVVPYWLLLVPLQASLGNNNTIRWIYGGTGKVYMYDGSTHEDITRTTGGDYSTSANFGWNGGVLSGIPVLNNGVDPPQMWSPPTTGTNLSDLTGWPASYTARVIRPFRNFLIALNIYNGSSNLPYMVKWSHSADPGSVPTSWDESDATLDAGEVDIGETSDFLVDCLPLGDANIVYKQNSTWLMQFIGPPFIFGFRHITKLTGMLATDCAVEFRPGQHCVLTADDVVVHNGVDQQSAADSKTRRSIFAQLNEDFYQTSFLAHNIDKNEVWVCIPTGENIQPTQAFIWNYREDTWTQRDLPGVPFAAVGPAQRALDDAWDTGVDTSWNDPGDAGLPYWTAGGPNSFKRSLLMAGVDDTDLFQADATQQFDNTSRTAVMERTGLQLNLPMEGENRGEISSGASWESVKQITEVWPRIPIYETSTTVGVQIGFQQEVGSPVVWQPQQVFTPATDYKVDIPLGSNSGRIPAIRFTNLDDTSWKLSGYSLEVDVVGKF